METKKCPVCGKELVESQKRFCSQSCTRRSRSRSVTEEEAFMEKVMLSDDHWLWKGKRKSRKSGLGTGLFWSSSREVPAHRWAYEHWKGIIGNGRVVRHTCPHLECVNPGHLYIHESIKNGEIHIPRNVSSLKKCWKCKKEFPRTLEYFSTTSKRGIEILASQCRDCNRIHMQEYRQKNPEKVKDSRKKYAEKNKIFISLHNKNWREAIKYRVLSHYSGGIPCCKECGEKDIRFLSIDHIDGGGKKEARKEGHNHYATVIRKRFPDGYQVLCLNHNCGKKRTLQFKRKDHAQTSDIVQHLGGVCVCCGEKDPRFLTIDHIVPALKGPRNHPKELRESGYDRKKYQVMCFNCNMAKSAFGNHQMCPHQIVSPCPS